MSPQASASDYQLYCQLYQLPAIGGERRIQARGWAVVKGNSKAQQLTIDIADIHVLIPKGDRLRLRIQNRTPGGAGTIPFFKSADVDIEHTAARPSWIEIPVAKTIQPSLTSATLNIDTSVPADVVFNLEGAPGATYLLAFGASGISPGVLFPGGKTALLNPDAFTIGLPAMVNSPLLPNTLGTLDATGKAVPQPRIVLGNFPALGSLVGLRLNALAVVYSQNLPSPSNPLDLFFR